MEHVELRGIEGVGASTSLLRTRVLPRIRHLLFEQAFFGCRDNHESVNQVLGKTQLVNLVDCVDYVIRRESRIAGAAVKKSLKGLQVERVCGSAERDDGLAGWGRANL